MSPELDTGGKDPDLCVVTIRVNELWIQPVSGGPPQELTYFRDAVIAYAWSPDSARLAVARETDSTDVVLFKNFPCIVVE